MYWYILVLYLNHHPLASMRLGNALFIWLSFLLFCLQCMCSTPLWVTSKPQRAVSPWLGASPSPHPWSWRMTPSSSRMSPTWALPAWTPLAARRKSTVTWPFWTDNPKWQSPLSCWCLATQKALCSKSYSLSPCSPGLIIPLLKFIYLMIFSLMDPVSHCDISTYKIHRILFCARGPPDTTERKCFAFTCSHGDNPDTAIFQCHVFRCDVQEAVIISAF